MPNPIKILTESNGVDTAVSDTPTNPDNYLFTDIGKSPKDQNNGDKTAIIHPFNFDDYSGRIVLGQSETGKIIEFIIILNNHQQCEEMLIISDLISALLRKDYTLGQIPHLLNITSISDGGFGALLNNLINEAINMTKKEPSNIDAISQWRNAEWRMRNTEYWKLYRIHWA